MNKRISTQESPFALALAQALSTADPKAVKGLAGKVAVSVRADNVPVSPKVAVVTDNGFAGDYGVPVVDTRPIIDRGVLIRQEADAKRALIEAMPNGGRHGWNSQSIASFCSAKKRTAAKADLERSAAHQGND